MPNIEEKHLKDGKMYSYAGIGSRKTPNHILSKMTEVSTHLSKRYILRSGGAEGADQAFERGAKNLNIFRAPDATPDAIELASKFHPAWHLCSDYAQKLLGRNAQIILGPNLDDPVQFVICYCEDETKGGTSLGIRIARDSDIPVYNFFVQRINVLKWIENQ
jgi:hypothetical protein